MPVESNVISPSSSSGASVSASSRMQYALPRRQALKLSILIPVYNERRTLRTIFNRVLSAPLSVPLEIIVVDDCSSDGSREILKELALADDRVKVFYHETNQGKGAAIHT